VRSEVDTADAVIKLHDLIDSFNQDNPQSTSMFRELQDVNIGQTIEAAALHFLLSKFGTLVEHATFRKEFGGRPEQSALLFYCFIRCLLQASISLR
jgi:hypothetical protein